MVYEKVFGVSRRKAFKRLVANNRGRLYRMAYAWTNNPHLADDLAQQAMYKALVNQKQLRDMEAAEAWLFRILANCLTDYRRAKREFLSSDELELVEKTTPEHMASEKQLVNRVRVAVQKLPVNQNQVVTLIDLEGFAYAAVAQILDIPVGTVMSRLSRGRRALREHLINIRPGVSNSSTNTSVTSIKRVK